ncbi:AAA family ATPase [Sodalinema gerasimenkoae]|uniref:WD40 domain-containing protein n=1 Tax=Sodalinema gerasimenkoae TaxID=2862348 RepID=UPI00135BDDBF|nr:AAA family ATPase [Sodalinema gerasimenkoae]
MMGFVSPTDTPAPEVQDNQLAELRFCLEAAEGQFKLMFVRCNYQTLRSQLLQHLQQSTSLKIQDIQIQPNACSLFHALYPYRTPHHPDVLSLSGLEAVNDPDRLLHSANPVREEFRKYFPCPLLLWVNDRLLKQLIRLVPDFESWGTTYHFRLSPAQLRQELRQQSDRLEQRLLQGESIQWHPNATLTQDRDREELRSALEALQQQHQRLTPELAAQVQVLVGRNAYERPRIPLDTARRHFLNALHYWQTQPQDPRTLQKQALLHLHLGLVALRDHDSRRLDHHSHPDAETALDTARQHLQRCADLFEENHQAEAVAKVLPLLGETLHRLGDWDNLSQLAHRAISLHKTYGDPLHLALDYGFLAKIACLEERWYRAQTWADRALQQLAQLDIQRPFPPPFQHLITQEIRLLLVSAQQHLQRAHSAQENLQMALADLPRALQDSAHQIDPHCYLRLLDRLRSGYTLHQQHLAAFEIKQRQRSIEQQYGFRAFIGAGQLKPQREHFPYTLTSAAAAKPGHVAPEILASPRRQDIETIRERLARPEFKLITLYGPSGVGKTSLIDAGLVPALQRASIGVRTALPIVLRVYDDWSDRLGQHLAQSLDIDAANPQTQSQQHLLAALERASQRNQFIVLIFDQFEEFFFANTKIEQRLPFYDFLRACFDISYVKVLLSLREDYMHCLLECDRHLNLSDVDHNLLDQHRLYYLRSFSPDDTRHLIRHLSETRPHLDLEPALIDAIVEDLAQESGDVRPIELQLIGAQLQHHHITHLDQYRQLGKNPKQQLVEDFLEDVIQDCGPENEAAARHLLYRLTNKEGHRPIKAYSELAQNSGQTPQSLDLMLDICVKSGLVSLLPEAPEPRFQLVHDYLVSFIRLSRERADVQAKVDLQETNLRLHEEKAILQQLTEAQERQRQTDARMKRLWILGAVLSLLGAGVLAVVANLAIRAQKTAAIAEIKARNAAARAYLPLTPPDSFSALLESLRAGERFKELNPSEPELLREIVPQLQQSLEVTFEQNRIDSPSKGILDLSFSPDGSFLATVGLENTLDLWASDGNLLQRIAAHDKAVTSLSISADTQRILTGSDDRSAKLWSRDGELLQVLQNGEATVTTVAIAPDGETWAIADAEGQVSLWTGEEGPDQTIAAHDSWVLGLSFHPDGDRFATASRDGTVKLWNREMGTLLQTLPPQEGGITSLDFSPDGATLATSDANGNVWLRRGPNYQQIQPLTAVSESRILNLVFSPDGQFMATTTAEGVIYIWTANGELLRELRGHQDAVWGASFSPDGGRLASASSDTTVRLWQIRREVETVLEAQQGEVWAVDVSPGGDLLASAHEGGAIQLWTLDGQRSERLLGHEDMVLNVSFSPDGQFLVSTGTDDTVRLWRLGEPEAVRVWSPGQGVRTASFSPDGRSLVTAGDDGTLVLWRVADGVRQRTIQAHDEAINSVAWHPDGTRLISASRDRTLRLWSREGALQATLESGSGSTGSVNWVSFSPEGDWIASASSDNRIRLWTLDGELNQVLQGHTARVNWVSFSPEGMPLQLVSGSDDRTVRLWQFDEGQEEFVNTEVFKGHGDSVLSVLFSPRQEVVASASKDGTVRLWLLPSLGNFEALFERGCAWIGDYLNHGVPLQAGEGLSCRPD